MIMTGVGVTGFSQTAVGLAQYLISLMGIIVGKPLLPAPPPSQISSVRPWPWTYPQIPNLVLQESIEIAILNRLDPMGGLTAH
jgi:hypothetical protein